MDVSPEPAPQNTLILYVITKATWGGAQRYVYDLMCAGKNAGYKTALAYGEPGLLSERLSQEGFSLYPITSLMRDPSLKSDLSALHECTELFKKLQPDVVHLNSSKASFIGALACKRAGVKKIIFTSHGWAFTENRSFLSKNIYKLFHYLTVVLAHHTIVVSNALLSHTKDWLFVQGKISMIHLGITPPTLLSRTAARAALVEKDPTLAGVETDPWVGTIAELHKNKGLDIGISAVTSLSVDTKNPITFPWVLIGGGEEEVVLKKHSQNNAHIHFIGFLPNASQYLAAFDLFLLPSRTEALGYVLIEAGYAGVPALASNVGGIPEVVTNPAMRFTPGNSSELQSRLQTLLSEPQQLPALGEEFKTYVEEEFSLERMVSETFALY